MKAKKFNKGKPRISLVLTRAFLEVAKVGTFGAEKYGNFNYKAGDGLLWSELLDADLRHKTELNNGNMYDYDENCKGCKQNDCQNHSGLLHAAHSAWNSLALLEYQLLNLGKNDLWPGLPKKKKK